MKKMVQNNYAEFLGEIKERIRRAQYDALKAVNKELIALYWDIGKMIVERQDQYGWGKSVVENLAKDLQKEFSGIQGYSARNIWYMRMFYIAYREKTKLQPMVAEISWTKHLAILDRCEDDLEKEFYIRMTRKFGWTKNVLIHQIENKSYEKTLLNQTNFDKALPEKIKKQAKLAIPIKEVDRPVKDKIGKLVDQILAAKKKDPSADTSAPEKQIDEMVYASRRKILRLWRGRGKIFVIL